MIFIPNWVTNRLIIEGPNAEEIINKHITEDEEGKQCFDFNLIHKMPAELDIEKSSKSMNGIKLYIAKINPSINSVGNKEDKMDINLFYDRIVKVFKEVEINKIPSMLLRDEEVLSLQLHYKDDFNADVNLGEQAFTNLEKYGCTDWYDWRIENWGTKWNACSTFLCEDNKTIYFDTAWSPSVPVIEKFSKMYPELKITHEYAEEQIAFFCGKHCYSNGEIVYRDDYEEYSKEAFELYFDLWGCEDEFVFDPKKNTYVSREDSDIEIT